MPRGISIDSVLCKNSTSTCHKLQPANSACQLSLPTQPANSACSGPANTATPPKTLARCTNQRKSVANSPIPGEFSQSENLWIPGCHTRPQWKNHTKHVICERCIWFPFTVFFRSSSHDDATDTRHSRISAAAHRLLSNNTRRRPPPLCTMAPLRSRQFSRRQPPDPAGRVRCRLPTSLCQPRRLPRSRCAPPGMRSTVSPQYAVRLRKLSPPCSLPHAGPLVLHRRSTVRRTVLLGCHSNKGSTHPDLCTPAPVRPAATAAGRHPWLFRCADSTPPFNPQLTSPEQPLTYSRQL